MPWGSVTMSRCVQGLAGQGLHMLSPPLTWCWGRAAAPDVTSRCQHSTEPLGSKPTYTAL